MQCACIKKYLELIYTYLKKRECTMYTLAQERTTMKQPLMYVNNNITVMITSSSSFFLCRSINFFLCFLTVLILSNLILWTLLQSFHIFPFLLLSAISTFQMHAYFCLRMSDPYIHLQILKYCAIKLENILTWQAKFLNVIL